MEPEKTPRDRAIKFIKDLASPAWPLSRDQVVWTTRTVLVLIVLLGILTLIGLPFNISLWNWLDLLIVPAVLAIGGYLFTRTENRATQGAAERRAQDEALQAYLDQMSGMLIPNKDQPSLYKARPGDSLSSVARARTLTVLPRLEGVRKARVVQFLYESGLIAKTRPILALSGAYLAGADLREANLVGADLSKANLAGADLSGAYYLDGAILGGADLREANLSWANLTGADLSGAYLHGADLDMTTLTEANLRGAKLRGTNLGGAYLGGALLHGAILSEANLRRANLGEANLRDTNLTGADLTGAYKDTDEGLKQLIPNEELARQAKSLEHATMPDGQQYEDWIKDKEGRGEDGEDT